MSFISLISPTYFNLATYGSIDSTGATESTSAIAAAALAASNAGGGIVLYPPGTFLSAPQTLYSNVFHQGCGMGITTVKLKNGANADLFSANVGNINLSATLNTGSNTAVSNFGFRDITLDGNKAGQSSGTSYPLRFYGYWDYHQNLEIKNGYSGGLLRDFYGTTNPYNNSPRREPNYDGLFVHDCNGIGAELGGPTDSIWKGGDVNSNGSHNIHICPNASGFLASQVHTWFSGIVYGRASWLIEAPCNIVNCEAEGSDTMQVAILASTVSWQGGSVFAGGHNGSGIQIGQKASGSLGTAAVASPFTLTNAPPTVAPSCFLQFVITGAGASGNLAIVGTYQGNSQSENLACSGNGTFTSVKPYDGVTNVTVTGLAGFSIATNGLGNPYSGAINQSGGLTTAVQCNTLNINTTVHDLVSTANSFVFYNDGSGTYLSEIFQSAGSGILGTPNARSFYNFNTPGLTADGTLGKGGGMQIGAKGTNALVVTDGTTQLFNVNTFLANPRVDLNNGTQLWLWSGNFATAQLRLAFGTLCHGSSTTAPATVSNGTITTNSLGVSRVAPTGNITGVILQAGFISGQQVTVLNESAFTITMDVSGTSHVASGTTCVIAANDKRIFIWDSSVSLWF